MLLTATLSAVSADSLKVALKARYAAGLPYQLTFRISEGSEQGRPGAVTEGSFSRARDGRCRIELPDQRILFDGQWLWSYDRVTRQLIVEPFVRGSALDVVMELLEGRWETFNLVAQENDQETGWRQFRLRPAAPPDWIEAVIVATDRTGCVRRVQIHDARTTLTRFDLTCPQPSDTSAADFDPRLWPVDELIDLRE